MQTRRVPVAAGVLALLALAGAALVHLRDAAAQEASPPPAATTKPGPAPAAATPKPAPKASASVDDADDSRGDAAAGKQDPAPAQPGKPATAGKGSPQRFEPSEKVRPDFDVAFPVDI